MTKFQLRIKPFNTKTHSLSNFLQNRRRKRFFRAHPIFLEKLKHIGHEQGDILEEDGKRVGNLNLEKQLGKGASGQVFLGRSIVDPSTDAVAVKVIKKSNLHTMHRLEETNLEIGLLQHHGHHPNIIGFHGKIHAKNNVYLVMEKATMTLRDYDAIHRDKEEFRNCRQVAIFGLLKAVKYLHEQGIAHCDLKLDNVLMCYRPGEWSSASSTRLCDFGLAAVSPSYDPNNQVVGKHSVPIKKGREPETRNGSGYEGCAADMFSIGCILLRMTFSEAYLVEWRKCYDLEDPQELKDALAECLRKMRSVKTKQKSAKRLLDLLFNHLLVMDVYKRASASQALQHLWFQWKDQGATF